MSLSSVMPNRSLGLKLIVVCALVLLMAIPAMFISYIAFERSDRADEVTREVSERYGGEQYISGPILMAPYAAKHTDGSVAELGYYAVFADEGQAEFSNLATTIRKRSLFKVPTFEGDGTLSARFSAVDGSLPTGSAQVDWAQAKIVVALSDVRGLNKDVTITLPGGTTRKFQPADIDDFQRFDAGLAAVEAAPDGYVRTPRKSFTKNGWLRQERSQSYLSVDVSDVVAQAEPFTVNVNMALSGAQRLGITPFAQSTNVSMGADWADPGFQGGFPPQQREISEAGFSAKWSVPYLRRGIRAHGRAHTLSTLTAADKMMTVKLVSLDNPYQTVNRALKYSVLFIGLVFLAYFLFEVIVGVRVHPAQYILIGLAQSIFYLLLLAFAERIGFTLAFMISAGATIAATAGYAGAVFGGRHYMLRAGLVFTLVYGLLYSLMRMQDFALMIGALASFTAIAMTMYLTRNLNWYGLTQSKSQPQSQAPQSAENRRQS